MVIRTSQCSEALSYIKCALTLSRKVLYQITGHGREPQYRDLSLHCIPLKNIAIGAKIGTRRLCVHPVHPGNAAVAWGSILRPHRKRPEHLACLIGFSQFQRLWPNKTETHSGGFRQLYSPIQTFSQPRSILGRQLQPPPTVRCRPEADGDGVEFGRAWNCSS